MGYVPQTESAHCTALQVEFVSRFIAARIIGTSTYDPQGLRMRG